MKKKMKYNIKTSVKNILNDLNFKYIDLIRGNNPSYFTRNRKVTPKMIFLQMIANTSKSFKNELDHFYKTLSLSNNVTTWGFIKQRLKFNPKALITIVVDYLRIFYEQSNLTKTLSGYYVLAIDGSDIIVPSTEENKNLFGVHKGPKGNHPAMAKLSVIYDCLNKMIIDIQINTIKYAEVKSAEENLKEMRNLLSEDKKKIIIFDRGYPSIKLILNLLEHSEKFLFRLKSNDFKIEQRSMLSNDEWIDIVYDRARTNQFRTDFCLVEKLLKLKKINLRFVKVPITTSEGEIVDEYLLTNLEKCEFDTDDLRNLYHLRWSVETSYRTLKSNLKLEDFSGLKSTIVIQDIYMSVFVFNLAQDVILHSTHLYKIKQEKYKHEMKVNTSYAIGKIKTEFILIISAISDRKGNRLLNALFEKISKNLIPIRNNRSYSRNITPINKCRMSYKYSY